MRLLPRLGLFFLALSTSGCFSQSKDVSAYIARANQFRAEGNGAKARVELQNAFRLAPDNAQVNLALAKAEEEAGNLGDAIPYYARAASPDAHLLEPQLKIIDILLQSGRLKEASGRINSAIGSFPTNGDALAMRADLEEQQGEMAAARNDALTVLQKSPVQSRALAVLALLDLRNHNPQSALGHLSTGLSRDPDNVRLLQVQAATLMTLNQPDKAVAALHTIVQASPRNAPAQRALAELESRNGHFEQAAEGFRNAVAANPDSDEMQLAFVQFLAGQSKEADLVAYLQDLIARDPDKSIYDLTLAEHYRSEGGFEHALAVLSRARDRLADKPAANDVRIALAKVQAQVGRIDLAQADLQAVLAAAPQNQGALLFRSTLALQGGRTSAAIDDLLTVLRNNPVNGRAYEQLATAYLNQGDMKLAADAMRRAITVLPGDVSAQIRLAAFLQKTGNVAEMRNVLTQLTLSSPDDPDLWSANGRLALVRKDWGTATRSLARLRELPRADVAATILNGQIMASQGNDAAAVNSFRDAIDQSAQPDADLVGAFARASVGAGQAREAAIFLSQKVASLARDKQDAVWPAIMTLRADAHDFDGALAAFRQAVAISPINAVLYDDAAKILVAQGASDKARQVLDQGIAAGVPKWLMLLSMGFADTAASNSSLAMTDFKSASDENPISVVAANNYATLLADAEPRNVEALTDARGRLNGQESSTDSSTLDTIAWLDYRLGRLDEAKALLTRINAKDSTSAQRRFHLAAVLLAAGEHSAGLALLDTVRGATFPGSAEVSALSPT